MGRRSSLPEDLVEDPADEGEGYRRQEGDGEVVSCGDGTVEGEDGLGAQQVEGGDVADNPDEGCGQEPEKESFDHTIPLLSFEMGRHTVGGMADSDGQPGDERSVLRHSRDESDGNDSSNEDYESL